MLHIPEQGTDAEDFIGGYLGKCPGRDESPRGCDDVGTGKTWVEKHPQEQRG